MSGFTIIHPESPVKYDVEGLVSAARQPLTHVRAVSHYLSLSIRMTCLQNAIAVLEKSKSPLLLSLKHSSLGDNHTSRDRKTRPYLFRDDLDRVCKLISNSQAHTIFNLTPNSAGAGAFLEPEWLKHQVQRYVSPFLGPLTYAMVTPFSVAGFAGVS